MAENTAKQNKMIPLGKNEENMASEKGMKKFKENCAK